MPDPARRSIDIDMEYMLGRFDPRGHRTRGRSEAARSTGATLRISDAERNEVADRLSRHFADGRLDESEFTERLESAMSAKTQGELSGLFDDLPSLEPPSPPSRRRRLVPILLTTTLLTVAFLALAAGSVRSGTFHGCCSGSSCSSCGRGPGGAIAPFTTPMAISRTGDGAESRAARRERRSGRSSHVSCTNEGAPVEPAAADSVLA